MNIRSIKWEDALQIRHQVLWPDKNPEFCKVPDDENALHFGGFLEDKLISVASIYIKNDSARLRKFATLVEFQGQGIGTKLLSHIINELKQSNLNSIWCDARKTAVTFYKKFDMKTEGTEFLKSDVPYFKMSAKLR